MSGSGGFLTPASGGILLRVQVAPKASRERIEGTLEQADGGTALKVAVTAAPEGGKANAAVVKLLAKAWRLPKSAFEIRAGATSRRKVFFIAGDASELARRIKERMETTHD